jgi:hypothetical protein
VARRRRVGLRQKAVRSTRAEVEEGRAAASNGVRTQATEEEVEGGSVA